MAVENSKNKANEKAPLRPRLCMIAAMAANRVIGGDNRMLWHLPADMRHFKQLTMGKPILMGRKTFESLGNKPLPGRINIVITRDTSMQSPGVFVANDLSSAWRLAESHAVDEIMVIGGASIYEQALPMADRLYLTFIQLSVDGDAHFPDISAYRWKEIESHSFRPDASNPYNYSFITYDRLPDQQTKLVNPGEQTKQLKWDIV